MATVIIAALGAGCADRTADGDPASPGTDVPQSGSPGTGSTSPAPIHPRFELTRLGLEVMLADLPGPARDAILADPVGFLDAVEPVLGLDPIYTVLVDKTNALPESFVPADLVALDTAAPDLAVNRAGHRLTASTTDALVRMSADAAADGIQLLVSSTYRSYARQAELYAYWVSELGQEEADRVSARPGTSQHQLGTTVDFGCICDEFAHQPAGRWIAENGWRYGFSLSYPNGYEPVTGYAYEPWHFRYVTPAASRLELDYFAGIQQWMLEFLDQHAAALVAAGNGATAREAESE